MRYILVCLCLLVAGAAYAASSVVETVSTVGNIRKVELSWTDNATASFDDYAITSDVAGKVLLGVLDPGSTAPTNLYDVQLVDADGVDIFGGDLLNGDNVTSTQAEPQMGAGYGARPVVGGLTLDIDNQSVGSATGKVILYIEGE